jgi:hypothetical protein
LVSAFPFRFGESDFRFTDVAVWLPLTAEPEKFCRVAAENFLLILGGDF